MRPTVFGKQVSASNENTTEHKTKPLTKQTTAGTESHRATETTSGYYYFYRIPGVLVAFLYIVHMLSSLG